MAEPATSWHSGGIRVMLMAILGGFADVAVRRPALTADENTYVRDQNARIDPMFTIGTLTVANLRDILADLPSDAIVIIAGADQKHGRLRAAV